jgi:hypothetical protein
MSSNLMPSVEITGENNVNTDISNNEACLIPKVDSKIKDSISTISLNEMIEEDLHKIYSFYWNTNMTRHMRYKDQEIKYKRKDSKLLELGWQSLNEDKDVEVGGLVVPLDETSKSIQKKFRNAVRAHRSDWEFKLVQLYMSTSNDAEIIANCANLSESIKKRLPKVNGKIVLDVSRMNTVVTTNDQLCADMKRGTVHQILVKCLNISMLVKCLNGSMQQKDCQLSTTNSITDYNELLGLFPMRTQEQNNVEFAGFVLPDFQIVNLMGLALQRNHKGSIAVLRGCAAAFRLWSANEDDKRVYECIYHGLRYVELVPDLLYYTVKGKIEEDTARPFFSINKIKRLEDELGIGMYSKRNYKCNACGVDCDNAALNKCSGCSRVWYCGYECQKRNWSKHKHVCHAKWRTKPLYCETGDHFESMKGQMLSSLCIQVDTVSGDLFVFCLDPITNEVFDGLTDRPVSFLPPSEEYGTDSKSTA